MQCAVRDRPEQGESMIASSCDVPLWICRAGTGAWVREVSCCVWIYMFSSTLLCPGSPRCRSHSLAPGLLPSDSMMSCTCRGAQGGIPLPSALSAGGSVTFVPASDTHRPWLHGQHTQVRLGPGIHLGHKGVHLFQLSCEPHSEIATSLSAKSKHTIGDPD